MKLQDLTFERIEHYDPLNLRAKKNGTVSEWVTEYCEQIERRAFDVGFKTAIQLWQQLEQIEEIYKEDKP